MPLLAAAQGLPATGQGVGSGTASSVAPAAGEVQLSLASPHLPASASPELLNESIAVTVDNVGLESLSVSRSDFFVSAEGDIFGATPQSGAGGPTTIGAGRSGVLRLSFALPSAATKEATLYYRSPRGPLHAIPMEAAPTLELSTSSLAQISSSTPTSGRTPKAFAAAAPAAPTGFSTFPATG